MSDETRWAMIETSLTAEQIESLSVLGDRGVGMTESRFLKAVDVVCATMPKQMLVELTALVLRRQNEDDPD